MYYVVGEVRASLSAKSPCPTIYVCSAWAYFVYGGIYL